MYLHSHDARLARQISGAFNGEPPSDRAGGPPYQSTEMNPTPSLRGDRVLDQRPLLIGGSSWNRGFDSIWAGHETRRLSTRLPPSLRRRAPMFCTVGVENFVGSH